MIEDDLIRHEGYKEYIYLDSEGLPTFGIGHLIKKSDMESSWPVGTPVNKSRIEQVFVEDLDVAFRDARALVQDLDERPLNVQRVVVNMAFNLGYNRLLGFKKFLGALERSDYQQAAEEMVDSKWYGQVGRRSKELVRLMEWTEDGES